MKRVINRKTYNTETSKKIKFKEVVKMTQSEILYYARNGIYNEYYKVKKAHEESTETEYKEYREKILEILEKQFKELDEAYARESIKEHLKILETEGKKRNINI